MDYSLLPSVYSLLQPELMTVNLLLEILRTRSVPENRLENKTKDDLVQLFKVIAYPLPQREFDTTRWREKLWADNFKKNINPETIKIEGSKKMSIIINKDSKKSSSTSGSRLKPAIESNYKHKIIKLSSSDESVCKKGVRGKKEDETSSEGKRRKRITIDFSDPNEKSTATPKVVCRKRSNSSETDSNRKKIAG